MGRAKAPSKAKKAETTDQEIDIKTDPDDVASPPKVTRGRRPKKANNKDKKMDTNGNGDNNNLSKKDTDDSATEKRNKNTKTEPLDVQNGVKIELDDEVDQTNASNHRNKKNSKRPAKEIQTEPDDDVSPPKRTRGLRSKEELNGKGGKVNGETIKKENDDEENDGKDKANKSEPKKKKGKSGSSKQSAVEKTDDDDVMISLDLPDQTNASIHPNKKNSKRPAKEIQTEPDEDVSPPKRTRGLRSNEVLNGKGGKVNDETIKKENDDEENDGKDNANKSEPKKKNEKSGSSKKNAVEKMNDDDVMISLDLPDQTNASIHPNKKNSKRPAKEIQTEPDEDVSPPKRTRGLRSKEELNGKGGKVNDETIKKENDDEENDGKDKAKKSEPKKKKEKSGSSKKSAVEKTAITRVLVKKGVAAVDGLCPIARTSHIVAEGSDVWDCMLNQTNIQFNNNKYYLIQLLKNDARDHYTVWMRWGRVGCPGQNSLKPFGSNLAAAKQTFEKKFSDKTRNEWSMRDCFEKVPGKYDLLQMDYSDAPDEVDKGNKEEDKADKEPPKKIESKLHLKVRALIELICDVKAMEQAVTEMKFDAKKAPLGKLTSEQVTSGYAALKQIESIIVGSGKTSNRDLVEACNAFYTRIPHYFGMKVPPLIRTKTDIHEKILLLQTLSDIQAAMTVINQPSDASLHPADQHYNGLGCDIEALDRELDEYKILERYLKTTHGKTHTMYTIEVLEIYKVVKLPENQRFKDIGNRVLLWHGSRLSNWAGILSQGLKVAPPEAPTTGYMFGKGIYFADMASKSANYCMPNYKNKTGLMVLCEVALGKSNELLNADYQAHRLPSGCHSVKGCGRTAPDPKNSVALSDGLVVPMGPPVETENLKNPTQGFTLQYNEYIVYDVEQVKMKYLFKIQFNMK